MLGVRVHPAGPPDQEFSHGKEWPDRTERTVNPEAGHCSHVPCRRKRARSALLPAHPTALAGKRWRRAILALGYAEDARGGPAGAFVRLRALSSLAAASVLSVLAPLACAQGNYEVQVYASETVPPGRTMVELHSNFTFQGSRTSVDGVRPDEHALHETFEVTQGFTSWFEIGFYVFTSYRAGEGYQWVGSHVRPRVRIPEAWQWPVKLSISTEIGYQRRSYSTDTWTWEIRPIIDKQLGRWYLCVNPTLDRSFHGLEVRKGLIFAPNAKVGFDLTKRVAAGLEYYGSVGSVTGFDPLREQQHSIMSAIDLHLGPNWEFNFAVGVGLTASTDHLLAKMILGRRLKLGDR